MGMMNAPPPWSLTAVLLGMVVVMTIMAFVLPPPSYKIRVAFVGNSMQYVNDLPRFMQALAGIKSVRNSKASHIYQNSCLHGSSNFETLLTRGNGMYYKWQTENAVSGDTYDLGMCTVPQLLLGYDENLTSLNANGYYDNDGKNPCFLSSRYYDYLTSKNCHSTTQQWDYIVMNDNTKYPAIEEKVEISLQTLQDYYVPMLLETGATPILYATHGYASRDINMTGMGNVSQFTSNVFEGYRQYAELLAENLPYEQRPRIAPVGLAFLLVYEENHEMWKKLFYVDGLHPSPHGSYLTGVILYCTLYGHMPSRNIALPPKPKSLWKRARKMEITPWFYMPYPTYGEANYLYHVARMIMVYGHRPDTWVRYSNETDYIGKWAS